MRTCLDVDTPNIRVHDGRLATGEVERVPDVAAAAQEVGPPPVAHIDRIGPERQIKRVLGEVRASCRRRDVRLRAPGPGKRLCACVSMRALPGFLLLAIPPCDLPMRRRTCWDWAPSRWCARRSGSTPAGETRSKDMESWVIFQPSFLGTWKTHPVAFHDAWGLQCCT